MKLTVQGEAVPQGSMKSFVPKTCNHCGGGRRAIITSDNPKLKNWRKLVREEAVAAMGWELPAGPSIPIRVELVFFFSRPRACKALDKTTRPDVDKCARAILDSFTGVVFTDDAQVTELHVLKAYGTPRVEIRVEEADMIAEAAPMRNQVERDEQLSLDNLPF